MLNNNKELLEPLYRLVTAALCPLTLVLVELRTGALTLLLTKCAVGKCKVH